MRSSVVRYPRLDGPYAHGSRFRFRILLSRKKPEYRYYPTRDAAEAARPALEVELGLREPPTAERYVELYCAREGISADTADTSRRRLRGLLGSYQARPLDDLTPAACKRLAQKFGESNSPATCANTLSEARGWWRWLLEHEHTKAENPWAGVKAKGRPARRKQQLTLGEARQLLRYALNDPAPGGLAAAVSLLCGLREVEIRHIEARDVDINGDEAILWVRKSKTDAGRGRPVPIEAVLRGPLGALAEKMRSLGGPNAKLWPCAKGWLNQYVHRVCERLGLSDVCAYSLRGLNATMASTDLTPTELARRLGHEEPRTSFDHYVDPNVHGAAQTKRAADRIARELVVRETQAANAERCHELRVGGAVAARGLTRQEAVVRAAELVGQLGVAVAVYEHPAGGEPTEVVTLEPPAVKG